MKPLKPRDKVTQRMTRDGLTLDNQTTGESVNVSSREAEQEYTAVPPPSRAALRKRYWNGPGTSATAIRRNRRPRTPGTW